MGRLLASLIADSENGITATPATLGPEVAESQKSQGFHAEDTYGKAAESQRIEVASELRAKLESLALAGGIAAAVLCELPVADVEACTGLSDDTLRAYIRALRDSELRERGTVPSDETTAIRCARCGPVYAAPEVARVLPVVHGMPTAAGCPWCHIRSRGLSFPKPHGA